MNMNELDKLVAALKPMRVFKGFEIVKQGDPGDAFYLIASGRVSVWVNKGKSRAKVADLRSDDYFGEMALISNEPRIATVIAEGLTELFILQKADFDKIFMKNPAIAEKLRAAYEKRGQASSDISKSPEI
jgi:CRP-like cAMP-binding protein